MTEPFTKDDRATLNEIHSILKYNLAPRVKNLEKRTRKLEAAHSIILTITGIVGSVVTYVVSKFKGGV